MTYVITLKTFENYFKNCDDRNVMVKNQEIYKETFDTV